MFFYEQENLYHPPLCAHSNGYTGTETNCMGKAFSLYGAVQFRV